MDPITVITGALIAGAAEAAKPTAAQMVKDAYSALKNALIKRFGQDSEVVDAATKAGQNPGSKSRAGVLEEELTKVKAELDAEIADLAKKVDEAMKADGKSAGTNYTATLTGDGAIAQGEGATAVGKGGVVVKGENTGNINTGTQINTGGGAFIGGSVSAGKDIIGRDKFEAHYHGGASAGGQRKPDSPLAQKLYEALSGYAFNTDDLQDLMFGLDVDWDSLTGDNKMAKARSIVDYFAKENRLDDLLQAAKAKRPRYAW